MPKPLRSIRTKIFNSFLFLLLPIVVSHPESPLSTLSFLSSTLNHLPLQEALKLGEPEYDFVYVTSVLKNYKLMHIFTTEIIPS